MNNYQLIKFKFGGGLLDLNRISVSMEVKDDNTAILEQVGCEKESFVKLKLQDSQIAMIENFANKSNEVIRSFATDIAYPIVFKQFKNGTRKHNVFDITSFRPILKEILPRIWFDYIYNPDKFITPNDLPF